MSISVPYSSRVTVNGCPSGVSSVTVLRSSGGCATPCFSIRMRPSLSLATSSFITDVFGAPAAETIELVVTYSAVNGLLESVPTYPIPVHPLVACARAGAPPSKANAASEPHINNFIFGRKVVRDTYINSPQKNEGTSTSDATAAPLGFPHFPTAITSPHSLPSHSSHSTSPFPFEPAFVIRTVTTVYYYLHDNTLEISLSFRMFRPSPAEPRPSFRSSSAPIPPFLNPWALGVSSFRLSSLSPVRATYRLRQA